MTEKWQRGNWWEDAMLKRSSPIYGPVNTATNLIYPVMGILSGNWIFALAMCWLGIGSGLYHALKTGFASACDDSGMFAVLGYLATGSWLGAVVGATAGLLRYRPGWFRSMNLVHSIGIVFVIIILQASWIWDTLLAVACFGAAYFLWNVGRQRWDQDGNPDIVTVRWYSRYCHGVWHLLTGIGFYMLLRVL